MNGTSTKLNLTVRVFSKQKTNEREKRAKLYSFKRYIKKKDILDTEIKTKQSKTTLAKHHASV